MKNKPVLLLDIDPGKPLDIGYQDPDTARRWAYRDKERDEFLENEMAETISYPYTYNHKTKQWEDKPQVYKRGFKAYIYPPNENHCGIVTTDPTRKAFEGLDIKSKGTKPKSTNLLHTWSEKFGKATVAQVIQAYKQKLYQDTYRIMAEVGHIPAVSMQRYRELKAKHGDTNPEPDLSRFDMEMAEKFIDNGTLTGAVDLCEGCGYPEIVRYRGPVYVLPNCKWKIADVSVKHNGKIYGYDFERVGEREFPAATLEEAKHIAKRRGIFVIKCPSKHAEEPNKNGRVYIKSSKDPVVSVWQNGDWVDQLEYLEEHMETWEDIAGHVDEKFKPKKQTNDGRDTCYSCGSPTRKLDTGLFQDMRVCTKCGK